MRPKNPKNPILALIGLFLLIVFILEIPLAGMLIYYGATEGHDFGGTMDIHGEVTGENGIRLSGAIITIEGTDVNAVSDSRGSYRIRDAPIGIRKITVSANGYKEESHRILIDGTFGNTLDFKLQQGSGNKDINDLWYFLSLAILILVFSPFTFFGAYFSFKSTRFSVALVGAILGVFIMSPILVLSLITPIFILATMGFILSSSALMFVVIHRRSYTEKEHPVIQDEVSGVGSK